MRKMCAWFLTMVLAVAVPAFAAQAAGGAGGKASQAKTPAGPVNLNTASETDLESLPGVGPATAKKIIAGRPYAAIADLAKAGVPKNTIEKITPLVTIGAASSTMTTPKPAPAPAAATPPSAAASAPAAAATTGAAAATGAQQPPVKGMVWVNLSTKVYHKEGDRYYGNTKNGKFMNEADAIKAGYRAAKTGGKPKS
jgi:hypothetical protein